MKAMKVGFFMAITSAVDAAACLLNGVRLVQDVNDSKVQILFALTGGAALGFAVAAFGFFMLGVASKS